VKHSREREEGQPLCSTEFAEMKKTLKKAETGWATKGGGVGEKYENGEDPKEKRVKGKGEVVRESGTSFFLERRRGGGRQRRRKKVDKREGAKKLVGQSTLRAFGILQCIKHEG